MYKKGHVGIAMMGYAPIMLAILFYDWALLPFAAIGWVIAVSLSTLPDIDIKIDFIKHRGPTHTIWFAFIMGIVSGASAFGIFYLFDQVGVLAFMANYGFVISDSSITLLILFCGFSGAWGIISHIVGDAITPMGIWPFKPVSDWKIQVTITRAANPLANWAFYVLGVIFTALSIYLPSPIAPF